MATNFPASLDNWSNPTETTYMDDVGFYHDEAHANIYDAVEAVQAEWLKVYGVWPSSGSTASNFYVNVGNTESRTHAPGYLSATPFVLPVPITITEVWVNCTGSVSDSSLRIGFYGRNGSNGPSEWVSMAPGALLGTAGTVSGTASGWKSITSISISIPIGLNWMAWLAEGTGTASWDSTRADPTSPSPDPLLRFKYDACSENYATSHTGISKSGVSTGSLPDPWPTGSSCSSGTPSAGCEA